MALMSRQKTKDQEVAEAWRVGAWGVGVPSCATVHGTMVQR